MLRLRAVVCLLALAQTGAGAGAAEPGRSVLEVPLTGDEVRTDGSDDLGFSAESESAVSAVPGSEHPRPGVTRLWGVADTTAPVGRLFVHAIDKHAFQGDITRYEVSFTGMTCEGSCGRHGRNKLGGVQEVCVWP